MRKPNPTITKSNSIVSNIHFHYFHVFSVHPFLICFPYIRHWPQGNRQIIRILGQGQGQLSALVGGRKGFSPGSARGSQGVEPPPWIAVSFDVVRAAKAKEGIAAVSSPDKTQDGPGTEAGKGGYCNASPVEFVPDDELSLPALPAKVEERHRVGSIPSVFLIEDSQPEGGAAHRLRSGGIRSHCRPGLRSAPWVPIGPCAACWSETIES